MGVVISNLISPYGLPDIIIGAAANFAVGLVAYWLRRWQSKGALVAASIQASVIVAFFIGVLLLGWVYSSDSAANFVAILVGELVACVGLGVPLNLALKTRYR